MKKVKIIVWNFERGSSEKVETKLEEYMNKGFDIVQCCATDYSLIYTLVNFSYDLSKDAGPKADRW